MEYGRVGEHARTLRWLKIGDILFWGDPNIGISQISACPENCLHCLRLALSSLTNPRVRRQELSSAILPVAPGSRDRVEIQGCQCLEVYPGQVDFVIRPS